MDTVLPTLMEVDHIFRSQINSYHNFKRTEESEFLTGFLYEMPAEVELQLELTCNFVLFLDDRES